MLVGMGNLPSLAQEQMTLDVYNMANTPVFSTSSFKTICAGKEGYLWAGTANQGLYKFDGTGWSKIANTLLNNNINDIKADDNGGIWIAQSGHTGAQAITGGIHHFPDTSSTNFTYYGATMGVPTRNTRALFIHNLLINPVNQRQRVWSANMGHVTAGVSGTGAVGRGNANTTSPFFNSITAGIQTANGLGSVPAIGGSGTHIWAWAQANNGRSTIFVYNINSGVLLDSFNHLNSILPQSFQARAIYYDFRHQRWWVGMLTGELYVYENGVWKLPNIPYITAAVNTNAIDADIDGNVYIGTQSGLIVHRAGGSVMQASSYKKYTSLNGLPASNVQGVRVNDYALKPTVLLATSSGIAIWRPVFFEVSHIKAGFPNGLRHLFPPSDTVRIAADSTQSTLLKLSGPNVSNYRFQIAQDVPGQNSLDYGKVIPVTRNADSIVAILQHPSLINIAVDSLKRTLLLQVYDSVNAVIVHNFPLYVYRPPVLMVHGLWSDKGCFAKMRERFVAQGRYMPEMLALAEYPGDKSFAENLPEVRKQLFLLLEETVRTQHISAGKADVVGHSMGGVLLRLCLQSADYDATQNMRRLITLNTPHAGSTWPNFLLKSDHLELQVLAWIIKGNPYGGALRNLRVNSPQIMYALNGPPNAIGGLNRNKVPSHALVTTKPGFDLPPLNFVLPQLPLRTPRERLIAALIRLYALTTSGGIFQGDEHDWVVRRESQEGGLSSSYTTQVPGLRHDESTDDTVVANAVAGLLDENPNGPLFTSDGFYPSGYSPLPYPAGFQRAPGKRMMKTTAGTLDLTLPAAGSAFVTGTPITINFTQTLMDTIVFIAGSPSNPVYASYLTPPATGLTFTVPSDYYGPVTLTLMGFNSTGFGAMDTVTVHVTTTATLQNILPQTTAYSIPKGRAGMLTLRGVFSDNITRSLTGSAGITYTFSQGRASFDPLDNTIHGDVLGNDTLTVVYLGQTTAIPISVIDSSYWVNIPLDTSSSSLAMRLGDLDGTVRDTTAHLRWDAYNEEWTEQYAVQCSADGRAFETIGILDPQASGLPVTTYNFRHRLPATGARYYRIEANDLDGAVTYSNTVMLGLGVQAKRNEILLSPNPASASLHVTLTAADAQPCLARITDANGVLVLKHAVRLQAGANRIPIPLDGLVPGSYVFQVQVDKKEITNVFIKQ